MEASSSEQPRASSSSGRARRSRGDRLHKLMAAAESKSGSREEEDPPFVSTVVYSSDEEEKRRLQVEEASFTHSALLNERRSNQQQQQQQQQTSEKQETDNTLIVASEDLSSTKRPKPRKDVGQSRAKMTIFTTLVFVDTVGERREVDLDRRPVSYAELQRAIARLTPRRDIPSQPMFVVQNERGEKVFPENFTPSGRFIVRELMTRPPPFAALKSLRTRFETEDYHEVRFKEEMARVEDS